MSTNATITGAAIVISVVNGKGGSGKTPTAVQLSFSLARMGYKVLFCDLDQQGSASFHFLGFKYKRQQPTIFNALKDLTYVEPLIPAENLPNLHLLPAHDELSGLEIDLPGKKGLFWQGRLSDLLNIYSGYDFIICDTPGSAVSIFPTMALTSADLAIVPTKTEIVYVVGTQDTINLIDDVKGTPEQRRPLNDGLKLWGILPCQYEVNVGSHNDAIKLLEQLYGKKGVPIYSEPSRKTTLYNEATEGHIDIRDTDSSKGPILGAYWDTIATDIVNKSVAIVEGSKRT